MEAKRITITEAESDQMEGHMMLLPVSKSKNLVPLLNAETLADICPEAMDWIIKSCDGRSEPIPEFITVKFMDEKDLPLGVMQYIRSTKKEEKQQ